MLTIVKSTYFDSHRWQVIATDSLDMDSFLELDCRYIVVGDTKHTPPEIEISPAIMTSDPGGLIFLMHCVHPPYFLPKDQVIAQAIPIPTKLLVDNTYPDVYWVEVVGEDKPIIGCGIH
ncbi:hypothetical protein DUI87_19049 [Hirundo rustica rustica]|uniref:Uncharacterized protein n=1 Tax=Hirundo rustica rustica TaxID=333673 RepID=A0A3M0JZB6_HIRRU|nr:hypothetical protein DUI87_19049 [Hirundo rustica rustica]